MVRDDVEETTPQLPSAIAARRRIPTGEIIPLDHVTHEDLDLIRKTVDQHGAEIYGSPAHRRGLKTEVELLREAVDKAAEAQGVRMDGLEGNVKKLTDDFGSFRDTLAESLNADRVNANQYRRYVVLLAAVSAASMAGTFGLLFMRIVLHWF